MQTILESQQKNKIHIPLIEHLKRLIAERLPIPLQQLIQAPYSLIWLLPNIPRA